MSFDLKIAKGDLQLNGDGTISLVSGNQKLRQDILKILLTTFGDNKYHVSYGSNLSQLEIGSADIVITENEIKSSVISSINTLMSMQRSQARYQTLYPSEVIVSVLDVQVGRDNLDPRMYNLRLSILTQQLTEVFDNITIRLV
jgi:phage baseplate assembly protein W